MMRWSLELLGGELSIGRSGLGRANGSRRGKREVVAGGVGGYVEVAETGDGGCEMEMIYEGALSLITQ